ncbi:MAG: VWA domain-containing protein [Candidatus Nitronauta litoralis]|uniref:VWA domain-containing protein n=1 Tax=Candidatus Nitronauta litoralis TaxID=2705533 RepID=A0A7T0G243_9BACT|nr:MAG: VWA domain-containing protein [Candidatus Nitronauta litoralis]
MLFTGALAQPRWGFQWDQLHQRGADVIVAFDVSTSMLATDIKPNRLERAKRKVTDLIHMLNGDRIGLVAFAGTSFVQCPLTLDYEAAEIFLSALDVDLIPVQGTALGHAIRTSINAFSKKEKKSKALILITDGEDHSGTAMMAAQEAREEGVKIFVIGIGSDDAVPIPDPSSGGGFKKDAKGNVVMSRLNETLLRKIAEETGGSFVRSVTGDLDLEKIYEEEIKTRVEQKDLKSNRRRRWQEQFQWFIALGLVFLVVERGIRER